MSCCGALLTLADKVPNHFQAEQRWEPGRKMREMPACQAFCYASNGGMAAVNFAASYWIWVCAVALCIHPIE